MENYSPKSEDGNRYGYDFHLGNWSLHCSGKKFRLNNNGIKLYVKEDEGLNKVVFDPEKKTVEVVVSTPTAVECTPRIADLSDSPEFFNELHEHIEEVLLAKDYFGNEYKSVTPNKDRTVFEVA